MKVAIFGLGYVGCTAAACIARQGHDVVGVDPSETKVAAINSGQPTVREPGLDAMVAEAVNAGRLRAVTSIGDVIESCDIAVVCVGTPSGVEGAHDMRHVIAATRSVAEAMGGGRAAPLTVAYRSTMRPGSVENLVLPIFRHRFGEDWAREVELVYNPEFLREASAIADYFAPPKIVIGTMDGGPNANMAALHDGIDAPTFHVGLREAELTKFVDNSWHAAKVAFANEIGRVCRNLGISAAAVHEIFAADTKLNISAAYTRPGNAYGGSCLPKDVRALQHMAADVGASAHLVDALIRSNEAHKLHQFRYAVDGLEEGARVLLVGLAFKQGTDDLRESPSVDLARRLLDAGYDLDIYDPAIRPEQLIGQNLGYAFAVLPTIETLLVGREVAEGGGYARVIATNGLVGELELGDTQVLDVSAIP